MRLVEPLASGVVGAEGGTAEIYRRGTTTRTLLYTDFEATRTPVYSPVALGQHGEALVYVNELATVYVYDEQGVLAREPFVVGGQATAVEVISDKFTGTDYETGHVGTGEPVSLIEVLEYLYESITTVEAAGEYFNVVRDYGAVGDGVTDDWEAVQDAVNAASAAGGGTVHFPAGTYLMETTLTHPPGVRLLGAAHSSTVLHFDLDEQYVAISQTLSDNQACVIEGLGVERENGIATLIEIATEAEETAQAGWSILRGVRLGVSGTGQATAIDASTAPGQYATVMLQGCELYGNGNDNLVECGDNDPARLVMFGCRVVGEDSNLIQHMVKMHRGIVALCSFDVRAMVSGTASVIEADPYPTTLRSVVVAANEFLANADYSGSGACIAMAAPGVLEVANGCGVEELKLVKVNYTVGADGDEKGSLWLTREQRLFVHELTEEDSGGVVTVDASNYGSATIIVPSDWAYGGYAVFTVQVTGKAPAGARLSITIENRDNSFCVPTFVGLHEDIGAETITTEQARTLVCESVMLGGGLVWLIVADTDDIDLPV